MVFLPKSCNPATNVVIRKPPGSGQFGESWRGAVEQVSTELGKRGFSREVSVMACVYRNFSLDVLTDVMTSLSNPSDAEFAFVVLQITLQVLDGLATLHELSIPRH